MRALMSLNLHHQHQQQQQQPAGKREQRLTAGSNLADTANAPATVLFSARLLPFRDCHLIIAMCNLSLFSRKNGPRRDNGGPRTPPSVSLSFSLSSSEFDHLSLDFSILDSAAIAWHICKWTRVGCCGTRRVSIEIWLRLGTRWEGVVWIDRF